MTRSSPPMQMKQNPATPQSSRPWVGAAGKLAIAIFVLTLLGLLFTEHRAHVLGWLPILLLLALCPLLHMTMHGGHGAPDAEDSARSRPADPPHRH